MDKILKGAKPADLPVEQPTKFRVADQSESGQADRSDDTGISAVPGGQDHKVIEVNRAANARTEQISPSNKCRKICLKRRLILVKRTAEISPHASWPSSLTKGH